jgi:tetratricopeptide (TPR) repeat protein/tRNA A-37 threonylcarbamoyl transferase component Bud32
MAGDPVPGEERRLRLQRVREEIQRELGKGITLSDADWLRRYPDLEPELRIMLRELIGSRQTQLVGRTVAGAPETIASSQSPSPEAPPVETIASSTPPEPVMLGDPDAYMARMPSGQERTADLAIDARSTPGVARAAVPPTGRKVRYIGDYETITILGQGGMGVVYKARQVTLNRLVALKLIRNAEFASEDQVRRFQNEAEAVATLDHPGIVPIYEVGTFEDQRYFSMKLVEGQGLDKKLEELAKDPRAAARVAAEVADAVNHAHQRGILHRDLKPANILLDSQGHAHVTDFGLAKRIEEDAGLTVSGAIMGTPSYMAPEQAAGQSSLVTTASDVYGLGAILYAALTGRAPFVGDSVMNTLDQVRNSPPQSPTRLNVTLPRDLEVICLKCLEKAPRHRYASAQALSDDLNRWLRGEPIASRPVGPIVRLRMWARRKPALAGLSAALLIASIAGVIGVTWQWREAVFQRNEAVVARDTAVREEAAARKAESEAKSARDAAQAARVEAEQNAQLAAKQATLALGTIQEFITKVRTDLNGPDLQGVKTDILNMALKRIDGVASVYDKSTSKEATVLAIYSALAQIYREIGQTEKAGAMLARCLDIARERVKIKEYSDPSRQNLANMLRDTAELDLEFRRDMKACLTHYEESLKIWIDVDKNPKHDGFELKKFFVHYFLAEAFTRVATARYRMGEVSAAREDFRKAYNLRRDLVLETKDDLKMNPLIKQELSYSSMALAETAYRLGDKTQADEFYREALDQRGTMFELHPKDKKITAELASVNYMIGEFKLKTGDLAEARRRLEKCKEIREFLVKADDRNVLFKRDLAMVLYRLGNLAEREKDEKSAIGSFERARQIEERLVHDDPENDQRLMELMRIWAHVGQVDKATGVADQMIAGPNADNELRIDIARTYAQCARHTPAAQGEKAQTFQVKAIEAIRNSVREGFRDRVYLESEPDLEPIRNRDDFKQILGEIRPG